MKKFADFTNASVNPGRDPQSMRDTVPVFLTPQSIMTFPVASSVVTIIWKVMARIAPGWGGSVLSLAVISVLMGGLIFINGMTEGMTRKEKVISFSIAMINSIILMSSALGIEAAINPDVNPTRMQ